MHPDQPVWEWREFVQELPPSLTPDLLTRSWREVRPAFEDHDVYLLADSPTVNVKLRHRTNTLKIKRRIRDRGDGVELWGVDLDRRLPAEAPDWARALRELGHEAEADAGTKLETTVEAARWLVDLVGASRVVEVAKVRRLYALGETGLDVGDVVVRGRRLHSVAVESPMPDTVLAVVRALGLEGLGRATSYTGWLLERGARP